MTEGQGERGAIRKEPGGKLGVALVYPNSYRLGMANLGFHAVYRLWNEHPRVACERMFLPDGPGAPASVESGRPLGAFDVVAFSLSFEEDYPNVLALLDRAGLPVLATERRPEHPLVIGGGVAVQMNPEPVAPFFDAFLVGEGEELCAPFADLLLGKDGRLSRPELLRAIAELPGGYVPALYDLSYADTRAPAGTGWVTGFTPQDGAPERVQRRYVADLRQVATSRVIHSPDAQFGDLFLTEVARGCLWGCRFCAAGFVQRPYREVELETLRAEVKRGIDQGLRVGLVGPDTSDYTGLGPLTCFIGEQGGSFSPSSLRVDAITPELSRRMAAGGERSITIAPEAGTERLRRVINKDFSDDTVVQAAVHALSEGMQHVKMYFLCGLPTETEEDVLGMARLAVRIREEAMLPRARETKRMGRISLSVNPFVPKPWTPFQWAGLAAEGELLAKRKLLERELRPRGIDVDFLSPREAFLQTLLSRGDRRVAGLLLIAHRETGGDLKKALRRWPHDPGFFVGRQAGLEERLPWDFIDQGLEKRFLQREWKRGVEARITPKCALESCRACGLDCAEHPELRLPERVAS